MRLLKYVAQQPNGCWHWTGAKDRYGYGRVSKVSYGESLAHRALYSHLKKPIATGLYLCHRCDNPQCVNPEHMFEGTQADNLRDAQRKGRRLGEIPKKVTSVELTLIKEGLAKGKTQREISKEIGISEAHLSYCIHTKLRKKQAHVHV